MAKFLKSLFHPGQERKRNSRGDCLDEERNEFTPPIDSRRKLSISRSGRMKQFNKKRQSLSNDLFNDNIHKTEKPTSTEYHVHGKAFTQRARRSFDATHKNMAIDRSTDKDNAGSSTNVASGNIKESDLASRDFTSDTMTTSDDVIMKDNAESYQTQTVGSNTEIVIVKKKIILVKEDGQERFGEDYHHITTTITDSTTGNVVGESNPGIGTPIATSTPEEEEIEKAFKIIDDNT